MNLSSLRDQTAKFAGDPNRTRYADADYLTALNRAQEQFAMETRSLWKDATWTSAADDATYAFSASTPVSSDFMFEDEIHFDGKPLLPISRRDLSILAPGTDWTLATGTPTHYIVDPEEAVKGIQLYPKPTSNDAGKTISIRYFPLPAALSSDTDVPLNSSALMAQFHIALCGYAAWLILATEEQTPSVAKKRSDMLQIYSDGRDKATDLFKNTVSAGWRLRGSRPA